MAHRSTLSQAVPQDTGVYMQSGVYWDPKRSTQNNVSNMQANGQIILAPDDILASADPEAELSRAVAVISTSARTYQALLINAKLLKDKNVKREALYEQAITSTVVNSQAPWDFLRVGPKFYMEFVYAKVGSLGNTDYLRPVGPLYEAGTGGKFIIRETRENPYILIEFDTSAILQGEWTFDLLNVSTYRIMARLTDGTNIYDRTSLAPGSVDGYMERPDEFAIVLANYLSGQSGDYVGEFIIEFGQTVGLFDGSGKTLCYQTVPIKQVYSSGNIQQRKQAQAAINRNNFGTVNVKP